MATVHLEHKGCKDCGNYNTQECRQPICARCIVELVADDGCVSVTSCRKRQEGVSEVCRMFKNRITEWDE